MRIVYLLLLLISGASQELWAQTNAIGTQTTSPARLISIEGTVEVTPVSAQAWTTGKLNQALQPGDHIRTREKSRAAVRLSNRTVFQMGELSEIEIPAEQKKPRDLNAIKGVFYFFLRDQPGEFKFRTPTATAALRGTEFNLQVDQEGRTVLTLLDGKVDLANEHGQISLESGERGMVQGTSPPTKTAVVEAVNIIQWCLYYPGVLNPDELNLSPEEVRELETSLEAYRNGDLPGALRAYPEHRQPQSRAEQVYLAALLLTVGDVDGAEGWLKSSKPGSAETKQLERLAGALRLLVAAVKFQARPVSLDVEAISRTATEWLAESYYLQFRSQLPEALQAARSACAQSTNFGFAWVRVAELEFSFGRIKQALATSQQALLFSPSNAQAFVLQGFLQAAQNRIPEAIASFDQAISLDGALGNAWLGRGLCRFRTGALEPGREDLQIAAALEPQRALLRSYLGKAFSQVNDLNRAGRELDLAKRLDPEDPTAWLYSALLQQNRNRINEAIADLDQSKRLNDNRQVYRSRLLLDQDQAVRGANLATLYRDAGMTEVALREAGRAVDNDYANASAHTFLANAYNNLRDPFQVNLRYETAWMNEYLTANLLAPANATTLSPNISQQEYGALFQRNGYGLASDTLYYSRGDWRQIASQYGQFDRTAYVLEGAYSSSSRNRPNSDFQQTTLSSSVKQDFGPDDSLFLQGIYYHSRAGDVAMRYDPAAVNPDLRVKETQDPGLLAGYRHQWVPGSVTIFLGGRIQDELTVSNPSQELLLRVKETTGGPVVGLAYPVTPKAAFQYRNDMESYTAELQHIFEADPHGLILGGRYQAAFLDTTSWLGATTPTLFADQLGPNDKPESAGPLNQRAATSMERLSAYGYYRLRLGSFAQVTAGLSGDRLRYPENVRTAPISAGEATKDLLGPKAGISITPWSNAVLRAGYSRSLGGFSFDQSVRLEPSQVAGFNQAYRGLIPESAAGVNAAERMETIGLGWEQYFKTKTWLCLQAERLNSKANGLIGAVDLVGDPPTAVSSTAQREFGYREDNLSLTLNQLVGRSWSLGSAWRISQADLSGDMPGMPSYPHFPTGLDYRATLQQVDMFVLFNHPSGWFGRIDALWSQQSNRGYHPAWPGDDFWQFNAQAGYRFWRRHAEITLGLLNLAGQDYHLNPLNLTLEMPHERAFMVRLKFLF